MKIIYGCLIGMLVCSCRHSVDNSMLGRGKGTLERQHEVREIVTSYFHRGIGVLRGPLTVIEVDRELHDLGNTLSRQHNKRVIVGGPDWDQLKPKLKQSDEIYYYSSGERSWSELDGWEGYVVIRGPTVIDVLVLVTS